MKLYKRLARRSRVILIIQMIAMLMGTFTHVSWALNNGFLSKNYHAPLPTMIFWDALTFLDPIAAFLLLFRPKTGLILTLIIIVTDVVHNNFFYYEELYTTGIPIDDWVAKYWMILGQLLFALFALFTFRICWNDLKATSKG